MHHIEISKVSDCYKNLALFDKFNGKTLPEVGTFWVNEEDTTSVSTNKARHL